MPFIPATPGLVGFGGGNKPAVFQAVAPQYLVMNQQTDDDGPFTRCHDALGDTLHYAVSGVQNCGGCYTYPSLRGQSFQFSFTGVNGAGTVTWDGTSSWTATIGTETVTLYSDEDCGTFDQTIDLDIVLSVQCGGDNQFQAQIIWQGFISGQLFQYAAPAGLGEPISNALGSTACGTGDPPAIITTGFDGTITIST